jgi:hypothetical protein
MAKSLKSYHHHHHHHGNHGSLPLPIQGAAICVKYDGAEKFITKSETNICKAIWTLMQISQTMQAKSMKKG